MAPPPPTLLGPPSIHKPLPPPPPTTFDHLMATNFNDAVNSPTPSLMGYTNYCSATYLSTGNPSLDPFFHIVPDTPSESLIERLELSWDHNPLTTLKLIGNLRKSDKNTFYTAAIWLFTHHPKTLLSNLSSFVGFGYFKDLPEILFRILGFTHPPKMEKQYKPPPPAFAARRRVTLKKKTKDKKPSKPDPIIPRDVRIQEDKLKKAREKEIASEIRHQNRAEMATIALDKYNHDPNYQVLHIGVSDVFAGYLRSDLEFLNSGKLNQISLAAKWCPSLDSSFDRATLLCESIARKLFPKEEFLEYSNIEETHYAYRVRDRLRKDVLVPLRKVLELPEIYMSANRWSEIPYNRVPSVAMNRYKHLFLKHDNKRFIKYLKNVKSGNAKIAAGALLPHQIIETINDERDNGVVGELQWRRMVKDLTKVGKLTNCIGVCDVSRSMKGTPMEVSVALGLLLSELLEEPWKGKVITFSENPQFHVIEGNDLRSKTKFMQRMDWGSTPNFQKVFDLILDVAVKGGLRDDKMVKRVFVFSDMEFERASMTPWETDYMVIKRKFKEKGYGVPEMVFWNLRDSSSTPVVKDEKGVALVSGFSKSMMKLFLEGKEVVGPEPVMEAAFAGKEYSKLKVVD